MIPDEDGYDVLFVTVQRRINGQVKTYIEAFRNWVDGDSWEYVQSAVLTKPFLHVIGNMTHLANRNVQVIDGQVTDYKPYESHSATVTMLHPAADATYG